MDFGVPSVIKRKFFHTMLIGRYNFNTNTDIQSISIQSQQDEKNGRNQVGETQHKTQIFVFQIERPNEQMSFMQVVCLYMHLYIMMKYSSMCNDKKIVDLCIPRKVSILD